MCGAAKNERKLNNRRRSRKNAWEKTIQTEKIAHEIRTGCDKINTEKYMHKDSSSSSNNGIKWSKRISNKSIAHYYSECETVDFGKLSKEHEKNFVKFCLCTALTKFCWCRVCTWLCWWAVEWSRKNKAQWSIIEWRYTLLTRMLCDNAHVTLHCMVFIVNELWRKSTCLFFGFSAFLCLFIEFYTWNAKST